MEFISASQQKNEADYSKWVWLAEHDIKVATLLLNGNLPCSPDNLNLADRYIGNTRKKMVAGEYSEQIDMHLSRLQDRIHHLLFEFAYNEWREVIRSSGRSAVCLACGAIVKNAKYRTVEFRDKTSNLWVMKFPGSPMGPGCIKKTSINPFRLGDNYVAKK